LIHDRLIFGYGCTPNFFYPVCTHKKFFCLVRYHFCQLNQVFTVYAILVKLVTHMGALHVILLGDLTRALVETLFILTREAILVVFSNDWFSVIQYAENERATQSKTIF